MDINTTIERKNVNFNISRNLLIREIEDEFITRISNENYVFKKVDIATYDFSGKVIGVYEDEPDSNLIIIDVGVFKFYIISHNLHTAKINEFYKGQGTLLFDHFAWFENYTDYNNPPWLFYKFQVSKILKVKMPEEFINRYNNGFSFPSKLQPEEIRKTEISLIQSMENEDFNTEFYIISLTNEGISDKEVPFTFIDESGS